VIVFVVAQLRLVLAAQRSELCPPNALDLGLVDKLLLSDIVPVRRLWAILSFRYKSNRQVGASISQECNKTDQAFARNPRQPSRRCPSSTPE